MSTREFCWDLQQPDLARTIPDPKVWGFFLAVWKKKAFDSERIQTKSWEVKEKSNLKMWKSAFFGKKLKEEPMTYDDFVAWMNVSIHVTNTSIVKDLATT